MNMNLKFIVVALIVGAIGCMGDDGQSMANIESDPALCHVCSTVSCTNVTPADPNWVMCTLCTQPALRAVENLNAEGTAKQLCEASAREQCDVLGFPGDMYCIAALARNCSIADAKVAESLCGPAH